MTNYKTIRHAIEKECRRISLTDLCENWGFTTDDFDEYLDAADNALRAQQEQPNEPLTLEELREMDGKAVWCVDTDGTYPGLLCYVECVLDEGKEAHIWLLDNEGNVGRYNVRWMIECGASFYRRKEEQEG